MFTDSLELGLINFDRTIPEEEVDRIRWFELDSFGVEGFLTSDNPSEESKDSRYSNDPLHLISYLILFT